jgi:transcriptional regulator with XRE-family HTH domain
MDNPQAVTRRLIDYLVQQTGLDLTSLARRAGLAPSTLTRFMNQQVKHTLSAKTLLRLFDAAGIASPLALSESSGSRSEILAAYDGMDDEGREAMLLVARSLFATHARPDQKSPACVIEIPPARARRARSG